MLKIKDLPENILDEMYINYDELYDIYRNYNSRRNKEMNTSVYEFEYFRWNAFENYLLELYKKYSDIKNEQEFNYDELYLNDFSEELNVDTYQDIMEDLFHFDVAEDYRLYPLNAICETIMQYLKDVRERIEKFEPFILKYNIGFKYLEPNLYFSRIPPH